MARFNLQGALRSMVTLAAIACPAVFAQGDQDGRSPGNGMGGGQMVQGIVTTAAPAGLTVKTEQGDLYQVTTTDNTRVVKERQPIKMADIKPGDSVGAMGILDAPTKTVHAVFLMVVDAEQVKKLREGMGKVYIIGKVTAIDDLKLTIQRTDGVSQVIAVDEGTSFRKGGRQLNGMMALGGGGAGRSGPPRDGGQARDGAPARPENAGESITLADIKVGDTVGGRGELKNGVFVPTQLTAAAPNARRRPRPDATAPAAPPQ